MDKTVMGTPTTTPMKVPDWNQNDERKADYIKNRPFYTTYDEKTERKTVLWQASYREDKILPQWGLIPGNKYSVEARCQVPSVGFQTYQYELQAIEDYPRKGVVRLETDENAEICLTFDDDSLRNKVKIYRPVSDNYEFATCTIHIEGTFTNPVVYGMPVKYIGDISEFNFNEDFLNSLANKDDINEVYGRINELEDSIGGSLSGDATAIEEFDYTKYPLPVLYLDGDVSTMTKDDAVDLTYRYKDMEGTATVKWQGSSSLAYPKKNYTVKFDTEFEAKEGWGAQKKYAMKANWIDFSHSRNIAAAKIWGECIRRYEHYVYSPFPLKDLPNGGAVDGFPIVMVINGEYQGLYTFSIPKDGWMLGMDDSNVNHCIIGASGKNDEMCGFKAMPVIDDDEGFEYEHISDNATDTDKARFQTSIQNLYTALQNCNSRADLENNVGKYLDLQKAVAYMLYTAYIGNYDGITKNYLLVTTNGQKWHMSAYDLDSTFGNNPYGNTYYYAGQYTLERVANLNMIFKRIYEFAPDLIYNWYVKLYALRYKSIDNEFYKYAVNIPKIYFDEEVKLWEDIPGTNTNNLSQIMSFYKANGELIDTEIEKLKADKISVTFKNGEYGGTVADVSTIGIVERSNNIWGGQTANI